MRIYTFSFLFCLSFGTMAQSVEQKIENHITLENLKRHVYTLAADSMAGRDTGKPGQKMAAQYISTHFRQLGLDSMGMNSFYQPFQLYTYNRGKAYIMYKTYIKHFEKYGFSSFWGSTLFTHPITAKDTLSFHYIGFENRIPKEQLHNKVVVMLDKGNTGKSFESVKKIAQETSARYFVVITEKSSGIHTYNPKKHSIAESEFQRLNALYDKLSTKFLESKSPEYDLCAAQYKSFVQCSDTIMVAFTYPSATKNLFGLSYNELVKHQKMASKNKATRKITFLNDTALVNADTKMLTKDTIKTENILAFVEGGDKKHEVIVVSAHYDHVGAYGKKIMNGADDNASGTAAIMEMARAFQALSDEGIKPSRSILFVAFSGEEIGLRGADFFVSNCPVPIESVVLNMNLDMVGRNRDNNDKYLNTVYFMAYGLHKGFFKRSVNSTDKYNKNLNVSFRPGFGKRLMWKFSSDHYRFKRYNIPVACFFTGLHPDYHTERDTPDKIQYEKLTEITRMSAVTLWKIANSTKNIKVNVKKPKKKSLVEKVMD